MLIRRAELHGQPGLDLRVEAGLIAEIGPDLDRRPGEPVLDAAGGALLPGLHDHHIHLLALATAMESIPCGPPAVRDREALAGALAAATPRADGWLRGVGYHESIAGPLDRWALDTFVSAHPLRIQHRSGALWMLNGAGLDRLGLEGRPAPAGLERDERGVPTGRLFRLDAWLRERIGSSVAPDLTAVGRRLADYGVTGVTDASPDNDATSAAFLSGARVRGALPQRLQLMGGAALPVGDEHGFLRGAVKLMLDERALPDFDTLRSRIGDAHEGGRDVAIHCVTRAELVLAASAFEAAGARPGDRIEHASVAPPDVVGLLARLPLTVVTQPGFVHERGDQYRTDVDAADLPWLYRCRGLLDAGIPLGAGTDAPFGDADPWLAMQAAVDRRTRSGAVLGAQERLSPEQALALFTSPANRPGGDPRVIAVGAVADLIVLRAPWRVVRDQLSSDAVAATLAAGVSIGSPSPAAGPEAGA